MMSPESAAPMGGGITPSNTLLQGDFYGGFSTVHGYQSQSSGSTSGTIIAAVSIVALVLFAVVMKGK